MKIASPRIQMSPRTSPKSRRTINNSTSPGKIHIGTTLEDTLEKQLVKETIKRVNAESNWMNLNKKNRLGPGDYDTSLELIKHNSNTFKIQKDNVGET